jgi:hypothetical protein
MRLNKKEQYLIEQGRSEDTIKFCKKCGIKSDNIVWFVNRIEKDNFDINLKDSEQDIKLVLSFFNREKQIKEKFKTIQEAIRVAHLNVETEENIKSRILHTFEDGHYIINLSPKELPYEGHIMCNCVADMRGEVKEKMTAILALKDRKSKTLCHIEIGRLGNIKQHFSKANTIIKLEYWDYINKFFKIHEDENFINKVKEIGVEMVYDVRGDSKHQFLPYISSSVPTQYTSSIFDSKSKKFTSTMFIKEFANTNKFTPETLFNVHYGEVEEYLNKLKDFVSKSIDSLLESIKVSSDNFLILNDDMIKKIYGKLYYSKDEKLERLTESSDKKVNFVAFANEPQLMPVNAAMRRPHVIMHDDNVDAEKHFVGINEAFGSIEVPRPRMDFNTPEDFKNLIKEEVDMIECDEECMGMEKAVEDDWSEEIACKVSEADMDNIELS